MYVCTNITSSSLLWIVEVMEAAFNGSAQHRHPHHQHRSQMMFCCCLFICIMGNNLRKLLFQNKRTLEKAGKKAKNHRKSKQIKLLYYSHSKPMHVRLCFCFAWSQWMTTVKNVKCLRVTLDHKTPLFPPQNRSNDGKRRKIKL